MQKRDDKYSTNKDLAEVGIHVVRSVLVGEKSGEGLLALDSLTEELLSDEHGITFPAIVKPIRGRGSQGVVKVRSLAHLQEVTRSLLSESESVECVGTSEKREVPRYGDALMLEQFLDGIELTITVMPPGVYSSPFGSLVPQQEVEGQPTNHRGYIALPPVTRFNHQDGVAPYNGVVAVVENSRLLSEEEQKDFKVQEVRDISIFPFIFSHTPVSNKVMRHCERAAERVGALMPIRIDCRGYATKDLPIQLFDLNMKPNMTGSLNPSVFCILLQLIPHPF